MCRRQPALWKTTAGFGERNSYSSFFRFGEENTVPCLVVDLYRVLSSDSAYKIDFGGGNLPHAFPESITQSILFLASFVIDSIEQIKALYNRGLGLISFNSLY